MASAARTFVAHLDLDATHNEVPGLLTRELGHTLQFLGVLIPQLLNLTRPRLDLLLVSRGPAFAFLGFRVLPFQAFFALPQPILFVFELASLLARLHFRGGLDIYRLFLGRQHDLLGLRFRFSDLGFGFSDLGFRVQEQACRTGLFRGYPPQNAAPAQLISGGGADDGRKYSQYDKQRFHLVQYLLPKTVSY